jgi:uncharacterized protein (TIGR03435 family)
MEPMKRTMAGIVLLALASCAAFGQSAAAQPQFEAAQVRVSKPAAGRGGSDRIVTDPGRLTGTRVTLKRLVFEAYGVPYYRIFGGPAWLDSEEYDLEAKAESRTSPDQLKLMLRALLEDRFKLTIHRETRELRVYALTVAKNGPRLHAAQDGERSSAQRPPGYVRQFRCDLAEFANLLSIQLNMPMMSADPSVRAVSTGVPVPVLDKTGIKGVYDISVEVKPEPDGDTFVAWQRALQEQLGLKLEAQKAPLEVLVIDHAEKVPTAN